VFLFIKQTNYKKKFLLFDNYLKTKRFCFYTSSMPLKAGARYILKQKKPALF
jgi:hypothetical protein